MIGASDARGEMNPVPASRARRRGPSPARRLAALPLVLLAASPAAAHSGSSGGGFIEGFSHPLLGLDHALAMVAVGLWGAFLGPPALWLLPVLFPLVMAFGGAAGILGLPLPGVETGIAVSAVVLGIMVASAARPHLAVAAGLVAAFAVFHGHAHGSELPPGADVIAFSVGFVIATGLLHLAGIGFGVLARWPAGRIAVRMAGGFIALAGVAFLSGMP